MNNRVIPYSEILCFVLVLLIFCFVERIHADDNAIVIKAGSEFELRSPYKSNITMANPRAGSSRKKMLYFVGARCSEKAIAGFANGKKMRVKIDSKAKCGSYTLNVRMNVQEQVYRLYGRRYSWRNTRIFTETKPITVVVDMMHPSEIRIPIGISVDIPFPEALLVKKVSSNRKLVLKVEELSKGIRIFATKKSKTRITLNYRIGSTNLKEKWRVTAVKDVLFLPVLLNPDGGAIIKTADLFRLCKLRELQILKVMPVPSDSSVSVQLLKDTITLQASRPGEERVVLLVSGREKKKRIWQVITLDVEVKKPEAPKATEILFPIRHHQKTS